MPLFGLFGPPDVEALKAKGKVKGLIRALKYKKKGEATQPATLRQAAAEALGSMGDPRAVEPLVDCINREYDADVFRSAAESLVAIDEGRAVEALIVALKEKFSEREIAAEILGQIGDIRAVQPLITALRYQGRYDEKVRKAAAEALGQIADARAVEPLIARLEDEDRKVRQAAANALKKMGAPAVNPLINCLKDKKQDRIRRYVVEILGQLGTPAVEPLIAELEKRYRATDVRKAAAEALGQIGDPRATEPLVALLDYRDESMRSVAAKALNKLGWEPPDNATGAHYWIALGKWMQCAAVGTSAVKPLINALNSGHWRAAKALGEIGAPRAVRPLSQRLKAKDWRMRKAAAEALGQIGDPRAVKSLTAIREEKSKSVRRAVVAALDKLGGKSDNDEASAQYWIMKREWERCIAIGTPAVKPLIACLRDKDMEVRRSAVAALGQIGDPRAVDPLIDCLKSRDMEIRRSAVTALGQIGDARAVDSLIALFENSDRNLRKLIDIALGKIDWPSGTEESRARYCVMKQAWHTCVEIGTPAVAYLIAALNDKETYMRQPAAQTLEKIGNAQVVRALIAVLEDGNVEVRKAAIEVLGRIGGAQAVNPLVATFEQSDDETRRLIDTALVNIDWPPGTEESRARYCVMKQAWHTCVEIGTPAVEPLIAALNSKKARVRQPAAQALEKIGNTQVVGALITVLEGENVEARKAAIEVLGRMGGAQAVNPLVAMFEHSDNETRRLIDTALGNIDWPSGTEESRARHCVMKQAWHTCVEIGTPAVEPLIAALHDKRVSTVESIAITETLGEIGDSRAVEPLIVALKNKNKYLSKAAAEALGKIGDARAVNPLILAFQHSGKSVQEVIEVALDDIETGSEEQSQAQRCAMLQQWDRCIELGVPAIAPLVVILEGSRKMEVRQQAAEALGKIGDVQAVPPLDRALLNDRSYSVREAAAQALGMIGGPQATRSLSAGLKDEDQRVREAAAQALGQTGDAGALEPLTVALKDTAREVRELAAKTLGELGDLPDLTWETHRTTVRTLLQVSALDKDSHVRKAARKTVTQIGKPALEPIIDALRDNHVEVREIAAEILIELGWEPKMEAEDARYWIAIGKWEQCVKIGRAAVKPVSDYIKDAKCIRREDAARALGQIGDTGAVSALIAVARNERNMRKVVAEALGMIGDSRALSILTTILQDRSESVDVHQTAIEALSKIYAQDTEYFMVTLQNTRKSIDFRTGVARALGEIGDARAVNPLISCLKYRNEDLLEAAIWALGEIGDPRAVEPLIAFFDEHSAHSASAQALANIGNAQAINKLLATLNHENRDKRKAAAGALVTAYQSGKLSKDQQKKILEQRSRIMCRHKDMRFHTDTYGFCRIHEDDKRHADEGFDQDFPL